jgi:hypothetical protein
MRLNWGWRIAIVYTVFAIATLGMVAFTMTKDVDLVRNDYYEYTLDHDKRMQRIARAESVGAAIVAQDGAIVVAIPASVRPNDGTVELLRPSATSEDRNLTLRLDENGEMSIAKLPFGRWDVTVRWTASGTPYELQASLVL